MDRAYSDRLPLTDMESGILFRQFMAAGQAIARTIAEDAANRVLEAKERQAKPEHDRDLYAPKEVAHRLALSVRKVHELVASGDLRSIKIDGSRRIPAGALTEYLSGLDHDQNPTYWRLLEGGRNG